MNLIELKSKAYDILATIQQLQKQLNEVNELIIRQSMEVQPEKKPAEQKFDPNPKNAGNN
jgi:hypothetical protein